MQVNPTRRRVVVGVDGSLASVSALRAGAREARARHADLYAVIVADGSAARLPDVTSGPTLSRAEEWTTLGRILVETITAALGSTPDVAVHEHVGEGPVAEVLVRFGAGADLLILGAEGPSRSGPVHPSSLGAVVRACIWHARCPVVVVHTDEELIPPSAVPRRPDRRVGAT